MAMDTLDDRLYVEIASWCTVEDAANLSTCNRRLLDAVRPLLHKLVDPAPLRLLIQPCGDAEPTYGFAWETKPLLATRPSFRGCWFVPLYEYETHDLSAVPEPVVLTMLGEVLPYLRGKPACAVRNFLDARPSANTCSRGTVQDAMQQLCDEATWFHPLPIHPCPPF